MLEPMSVWLEEFAQIPNDITGDQAPKNMANFLDARVTGKLEFNNSVAKITPLQFTWQKSVFQEAYFTVSKIPSPDPISPAIKIANAWQTSMLASIMAITAGASISPPPSGTNGIAATAIAVIDPPTLATAVSRLISDLSGSQPVIATIQAEFPKAMYKAFASVTYTITGIDTKTPPIGPVPFVLPLTGVV